MRQIPKLKLFSKEELYCLLSACSESLTLAYQESNDTDFWHIAIQQGLPVKPWALKLIHRRKHTKSIKKLKEKPCSF
ncbi:hypothetical protein FOLKNPGA_03699 (plasmid) [Legionella sp. PC1000]|uniref:hypothetical protein n=1 Tax=Legionella sp. PC1000 TaxID=2746060 RepID=UPI001861BF60|nr:hypothetical protein [Legionella sp. PC1000]QLZ70880.1 hypothetical protein FOLKNPGA_03699 [Legionella sp. PC1000]